MEYVIFIFIVMLLQFRQNKSKVQNHFSDFDDFKQGMV